MLTLFAALALAAPAPADPLPLDTLSLEAELASLSLVPTPPPQEEDTGSPFSYTFVEIGAARYNVDEVDDEADIYYGRASLGLFDFLYGFIGYENQAIDFSDTSTDLIRLGVGGHFGLAPDCDLTGDFAWLYSDMSSDLSALDDSNSGYELRIGGRWMPLDWERGGLEVAGGILWRDLENQIASDDELFGWDLGARLHFLKLFSVGADYSKLEDDDMVRVNARVSF